MDDSISVSMLRGKIVITIDSSGPVPVARLSGSLDVSFALQLKQQFMDLMETAQSPVIDCTEVDNVDSSILQLFVALQMTRRCQLVWAPMPGSEADKWTALSGMQDLLLPSRGS